MHTVLYMDHCGTLQAMFSPMVVVVLLPYTSQKMMPNFGPTCFCHKTQLASSKNWSVSSKEVEGFL